MKTFIIISDSRKFSNHIENHVFNIFDSSFHDDIIYTTIIEDNIMHLGFDVPDEFTVFPISDFMELMNDEEINMSNYFMSYCFVK